MEKTLKKYMLLFVAPTLAAFVLAFIIPFIQGVYLSFCNFSTIENGVFVGMENYSKMFDAREGFLSALWFSARFSLLSILSINLLAFALAMMLTRKIKGTHLFRTVFFMPNLIGGIVLGYTWQQMLNAVLLRYETTLVADAKYGYMGLVLLINWQMIGYMMIIYIAGIQNVPTELTEAAKIDGASFWQTLRSIIIPMVMPSITICVFLTLSNSFKLYDQNLALTGGAPMHRTEMVALNIVNTFYGRNGYEGVGQAKAVVFFLIVGCLGLFQLNLTRKKEVEQ